MLPSPGSYNGSFGIPLFRLYNTVLRQHHWTTDENEKNVLSTERGWIYEGIIGHVIP